MKANSNSAPTLPLVCEFDLEKYLGTWYEIGKLPARWQNGLHNVTATYVKGKKGKILVKNVGYKKGKKTGIEGKAWVRDKKCNGGLYVQFFWPLKGEYNVIKLAPDYRYALVTGDTKRSLWILSRTPKMQREDLKEIFGFLKTQGFKVEKIRKTKHDGNV